MVILTLILVDAGSVFYFFGKKGDLGLLFAGKIMLIVALYLGIILGIYMLPFKG